MRRLCFAAWILAVLLVFAACAKEDLTEQESAALKKAADWFAWSLQTLEEEYTVAYDSELSVEAGGRECYLFRAVDADGNTLVYAAVPGDASTLWHRFTPEAEWEEVTPELWAEVELWTEGVG